MVIITDDAFVVPVLGNQEHRIYLHERGDLFCFVCLRFQNFILELLKRKWALHVTIGHHAIHVLTIQAPDDDM